MSVKKPKTRARKSAAKVAVRHPPRDLSPTKSGASTVRGGLGIFKTTHDKREAGSEN